MASAHAWPLRVAAVKLSSEGLMAALSPEAIADAIKKAGVSADAGSGRISNGGTPVVTPKVLRSSNVAAV